VFSIYTSNFKKKGLFMSPKTKTAVQFAAIGVGVVGAVVVAKRVLKSVRNQINDILTADDLLGCSSEQPFVASMQQGEKIAAEK
jgi:hypothetical protein